MNKKDAKALYASLQVGKADDCEYLGPPSKAELDQFESEFDVTLPSSYRSLITVFGPGELASVFRILSPYASGNASAWDLVECNHLYKKRFRSKKKRLRERGREDPKLDRLERLIVLSHTYRGESYLFDPDETVDRMFLLTRHADEPEQVADSFEDFIHNYCLGPRFLEFYEDEVRSKHFSHAYLRAKKKRG